MNPALLLEAGFCPGVPEYVPLPPREQTRELAEWLEEGEGE
jgi:hypothetical protein